MQKLPVVAGSSFLVQGLNLARAIGIHRDSAFRLWQDLSFNVDEIIGFVHRIRNNGYRFIDYARTFGIVLHLNDACTAWRNWFFWIIRNCTATSFFSL